MHSRQRQRFLGALGTVTIVAVAASCFLPGTAFGQEQPAATFRSDVGLVLHGVAVLDAAGRPVTGLEVDDFAVYEDGESREIEWFLAPDRSPVDVALLLDSSTSLAPWSRSVRRAAETFLTALAPQDCVFVLPFSDEPGPGMWGRSVDPRMARRIGSIFMSGGTALYDAVVAGLAELEVASSTAPSAAEGTQSPESGACGQPVVGTKGPVRRRAMIVVTDGADEKSAARFDEVLDRARTAGIPIFPVVVGQARDDQRLRSMLDLLAGSTGGLVVESTDPGELREAYFDVVALLRASYLIGYQAEPAEEPHWREVRVRSRRPSYRLVHRPRYFR